jgi:sarcosine oxidase, subunit beta
MKKSYDYIIIGGGIMGASLAFELARRGRCDGLLVEREYLASGATGRCAAGIRQQWGSLLNAQLAVESTEIFEHLEEYTGYQHSCGLNQSGYLILAYTEKEWDQFQRNLAVQHSLGVKSFPVKAEDTRQFVPHLNPKGLYGATFNQKDGHADPFHCTFAYADGAKRLGVEILTYTNVEQLLASNGKIRGVATPRGEFSAPLVINCANGWAPSISAQVGDEIPVYPERHQIMVSEPVAPLGAGGRSMPMVISFTRRFYVQQSPYGNLLMGIGETEPMSFNQSSSWEFPEAAAAAITAALPALRKLRIIRQWAGLYDMSPDRNPVIDFSKNAEGLVTICGFSGHGFMVAPRTAILVARSLCGERDELDIRRFSAERYRTGELLLEPSVV